SGKTIWKAVRGIVTGVSSPPSMTNLRGRMLAATLTPLTASGSAPGRTVLIARMAARSGRKSAVLRRPAASGLAFISLNDIQRPRFLIAHRPSLRVPSPSPQGKREGHRVRGAGELFRRYLVRGRYTARLHHHLDGIFDAVLGVADRGRQVVEREGVGVDLGGIEALLAHERFGAVRRALAFAANAVDVDVVAHDLCDIDRRLLVREGGEADFAATVDHADRLVDGVGRAGALRDVVDAVAAVDAAHRRNRILAPHVDDVVGAELATDREPVVACAGEDDRMRAERLGDGDAEEPDRSGAGDHDALPRDQ